jgi:hypothetical protein
VDQAFGNDRCGWQVVSLWTNATDHGWYRRIVSAAGLSSLKAARQFTSSGEHDVMTGRVIVRTMR